MILLTRKERETLLVLCKDFSNFYSANSISKVLKISHVGAQKIFKRLLKENVVTSKIIGKSIIYQLNLNDSYVKELITFLLADDANNFKRWKEEFRELFKKNRIVTIFGSAIRNYAQANDIDMMIIMENRDIKDVNKILKKKEEILPKKLHVIKLTHKDLLKHLKKRDKVVIDIVKNAIVLYGQEQYVETLKNVTSL